MVQSCLSAVFVTGSARSALLCCHRSWTAWVISVEGELPDPDVEADMTSGDLGAQVVLVDRQLLVTGLSVLFLPLAKLERQILCS